MPYLADSNAALLALCILALAVLYSMVGQAGASGYLAAMAFFGVAPAVMKPTALVLNILVAAIATVRFGRAGCVSWQTTWPFIVGSVPMAFLGGMLELPGHVYKPVVGAMLLFAAVRLLWDRRQEASAAPRGVPLVPALATGAGIGLLSGLTGMGGGVFLSPMLLLTGWAGAREMAGASAVFILVNSVAGLGGHLSGMRSLPGALPLWLAAAALGGAIGSELGSRKLAPRTLCYVLACVLVAGGTRFLMG